MVQSREVQGSPGPSAVTFTANTKRAAAGLCVVLCAALAVSADTLEKAAPLRISILSKHLRLLKERPSAKLTLCFPDGTALRAEDGAPTGCRTLEIAYGRSFELRRDGERLEPPYSITLTSESTDAAFRVHLAGEKTPRIYPLPLTIRGTANTLSIVCEEDPARYAADSAAAEFGPTGTAGSEALAALTMVIYARAKEHARSPRHDDAVFCDLTHCQTWKGRTGAPPFSGAGIDRASFRDGLFFTGCCGGETCSAAVFGGTAAQTKTVRDRLSSTGGWLCRSPAEKWIRDLPLPECGEILHPDSRETPLSAIYAKERSAVRIQYPDREELLPAEDFRLRINRVRGWSFIRSNNYDLRCDGGVMHFEGYGIGHGVGLCQRGALALSKLGFSRYEILEHYYPGIRFASSDRCAPDTAYCTFSLSTGKISEASYRTFTARRQPAGSIFKILVSMYIETRRPDLAGRHFTCTGKSQDPNLPEKCDKPGGHGELTLAEALPRSCNHFFCSLYAHIDRSDFVEFMRAMNREFGLTIRVPDTADDVSFAKLLAGLDFRATMSVRDAIALARIIDSSHTDNEYSNTGLSILPPPVRMKLQTFLYDTFIHGTAAPNEGETGDISGMPDAFSVWGKTSTYLYGTNSTHACGTFLGGKGDTGIIVVTNGGNGRKAALQALRLIAAGRNETPETTAE